ncbi:MAG: hypothetical protein AAGC93_09925 [Cyanobacteria bacterium P01_F01_bin.53]
MPSLSSIPLVLRIVFCVFLSVTIYFAFLRISLYRFLNKLGVDVQSVSRSLSTYRVSAWQNNDPLGADRQSEVMKYFEGLPTVCREIVVWYKDASTKLEEVNTAALIDMSYSRVKFNFLGLVLRCEQYDYICRTLPNFLLSLGLLGTFVGITINLSEISTVVQDIQVGSSEASDIGDLISALETPLQGMGIAFTSSLTAIFCSSVLTFINSRWNTTLAKANLVNTLENLLDNVFQPLIEGNRRLDRVVDRMVRQQEDFLSRFHEKVIQTMEATLGGAADRIVQQNKIANELATQVYSNFSRSSGTLDKAAHDFKIEIGRLEKQITRIDSVGEVLVDKFSASTISLEDTSQLLNNASITIRDSNFADDLENVLRGLTVAQENFVMSSVEISEYLQTFAHHHNEINSLATNILDTFQSSSYKFETGVEHFETAVLNVQESDFVTVLSETTQQLSSANAKLASDTRSLATKVAPLGKFIQDSQIILSNLNQVSDRLNQLIEKVELSNAYSAENLKFLSKYTRDREELKSNHTLSTTVTTESLMQDDSDIQ